MRNRLRAHSTATVISAMALAASAALAAPASAETITGTYQDDLIEGTSKADTIRALAGADWISSYEGADVVYGGSGRDIMDLGPGPDVAFGGPGGDTLNGQGGDDELHAMRGGWYSMQGGSGDDALFDGTYTGRKQASPIWGGHGNDKLVLTSPGPVHVFMGAGDDRVRVVNDGDADLLRGGLDYDTVILMGSQDPNDTVIGFERIVQR